MDVVNILKKSRKTVDKFRLRVSGELSSEQPIVYTSVHVKYEFEGPEANSSAALKAVVLSQNNYCGVSAMLKKIIPVTWEVYYNGEYKNVFSGEEALNKN